MPEWFYLVPGEKKVEKKSKGPGYHAPHRGRPGKRGGSLPRNGKAGAGAQISLMKAPRKLIKHFGLGVPTNAEKKEFLKSLDNLPADVRKLWRGDAPNPVLAIGPDRFTAQHKGNWIIVPKGSPGGDVAKHEFLHHVVSQKYLSKRLGAYNPISLFSHADWADNKREEDLAMMLTLYSPNPSTWAQKLMDSGETLKGGQKITSETARAKVNSATRFLKYVGGWD
jgi:hypothetical protein